MALSVTNLSNACGKSTDPITTGMGLLLQGGGRGGKGVRRCTSEKYVRDVRWRCSAAVHRFLPGARTDQRCSAWKRKALVTGCDRGGRQALGLGRHKEQEQFFITQVIGYLVKLLGIKPKIKLKGELIM